VVKEIDGKKVCYAKGYVFPDAQNRRNYLQVAKDLGKNVPVSIYGKAKEAIYNAKDKAYDIKGLALERIDWTPPGAEGIPNDGTLILTSEMHNKSSKRQGEPMEKEKVLKEATLSEMKQHNPKLVEEIEGGTAAVSEMADVRKTLGIDDKTKVTDTISEMQQTIRKQELETELRDRVKARQARPIIKQMVLSEMKSDESITDTIERVLKSDDAKAIISSKSGAQTLAQLMTASGARQPASSLT
jgi:hypothetical protein